MTDTTESLRMVHNHDWFMAWDYCGSHSYVCRVCSEVMDEGQAAKRVNEYPVVLARLEAAEREGDELSAWAEEAYLYLSDVPGAAEKSLMRRLREIRLAALAREETPSPDAGREAGPGSKSPVGQNG